MGKSLYKDKKGIAMIAVIMSMLVVAMLSTAVLSMAASNTKNSLVEREFQSSYYIAEAGANYHMECFKKDLKSAYDSTATEDDFFATALINLASEKTFNNYLFQTEQSGEFPEVKLRVVPKQLSGNPRTYEVVSRGTIDQVTRTVVKTITVKWVPKGTIVADYAVFSRETLNHNGAYINGPVGSNTGIILGDYGSIGDYYLPDGGTFSKTSHSNTGTAGTIPPITYPDPEFPQYPTPQETKPDINATQDNHNTDLVLNEDKVYGINNLKIESSSRVTIDIGNKDIELVVNNLDLRQGHIFIKGTGKLKLYVNNMNYPADGDSVINHPDPPANYESTSNDSIKSTAKNATLVKKEQASKKLEMYYYGTATVNMSNAKSFYGSLIVKQATLNMDNSGDYVGGIVAGGNVLIDGDATINTSLLYAPNSNIKIDGGKTYGPIIGKSVSISGDARTYYTPTGNPIPIPGGGDSGEVDLTEGVAREQ